MQLQRVQAFTARIKYAPNKFQRSARPFSLFSNIFLRAQLPLHARGQFGGDRVINGAGLPCQRKSTAILIFWNNVKVHMHHFLMRKRSVVLQNVVRRGAGRLHDCAGHMCNGGPQRRRALG